MVEKRRMDYRKLIANITNRFINKCKLKNQAGESIAEVLVALLISSLGLIMLAGMVSATTRIVTRSKTWTNQYVEMLNDLVVQSSGAGTGEAVIRIKDTISNSFVVIKTKDSQDENGISVTYYNNPTNSKTPVTAYKKTP